MSGMVDSEEEEEEEEEGVWVVRSLLYRHWRNTLWYLGEEPRGRERREPRIQTLNAYSPPLRTLTTQEFLLAVLHVIELQRNNALHTYTNIPGDDTSTCDDASENDSTDGSNTTDWEHDYTSHAADKCFPNEETIHER